MQSLPVEKAIPQMGPWRSASVRSAVIQTLKFALATVVVVYLILRGDIAWEPLRASLSQWQYTLPAVLLLALTPLGQLWRWQSLLRASHLRLPHREVFSYLMVSKFFNMAFPGYLSGDLIRGFYVSRRASAEAAVGRETVATGPYARPSTVAASIVFDRVAGLLTLFTFCLFGLLGSLRQPLPSHLATSVGTLAGLGLLGPLLLFLLAYRHPLPPGFLLQLCRRIRLDQPLLALYQGLHHYARDIKLIRNILGISFLNQGLTIVTFILFGMALGVPVPLISYWILVPLGLMVIAVPITPAGLGVGQVAFLALFHLVGTAQGANLFTLYMASYGLINLSGAVLFPLSHVRRTLSPSPYPGNELNGGSNP